jgi:hypothetical protein
MEDKTRIVIARKGEWMNRARGFKVNIDGAEAGVIRNGRTEEFQVAPGKHTIMCKVDWCSSRDYSVDLKPGETTYLRVKNGLKYYYYLVFPFLIVMIINLYFSMNAERKPAYFSYLIILTAVPLAIYVIYNITAGRRDYLKIGIDEKSGFGR